MYEIYTIKDGDTIDTIAQEFSTTPDVIFNLNTFNPLARLEVGKNIIVPAKKLKNLRYYKVKDGDNLYAIAKKYNTTPEVISKLNGLDEGEYIYKDQILLIPSSDIEIYMTVEGDTLNELVRKLDTNLKDILMQNEKIYLLPDQMIIKKSNR